MSVWIIRQDLSVVQERELFTERPYLILPFEKLPDLSQCVNIAEYRLALQTLHPEAPPEAITSLLERSWKYYNEFTPGDVVAVPLTHSGEIAIGEIAAPYRYHVDDTGNDVHSLPITWQTRKAASAFRKFKKIFESASGRITEVTDPELRTHLHNQLPRSYNRFSRWKWLLALLFAMQAVVMLKGLLGY